MNTIWVDGPVQSSEQGAEDVEQEGRSGDAARAPSSSANVLDEAYRGKNAQGKMNRSHDSVVHVESDRFVHLFPYVVIP